MDRTQLVENLVTAQSDMINTILAEILKLKAENQTQAAILLTLLRNAHPDASQDEINKFYFEELQSAQNEMKEHSWYKTIDGVKDFF